MVLPEIEIAAALPDLLAGLSIQREQGAVLATRSHHHPVAVSPCGNFSVEFAECLASCGTGPVCLVNDDFHESVKSEEVAALLAKYQS